MIDFIRMQRDCHNESRLPLKDIRVLDLGAVVAAPLASTYLGDLGADCIKVENPNTPDAIGAWEVLEGGFQP